METQKFEFIQELLKQEKANSLEQFRQLQPIKLGKYFLSIQASEYHYCMPKKSLTVDKYTCFEIAIFNKAGAFVSINRSRKFREFKRYSELLERISGVNSSAAIYAYVDAELLNDLYLFLKN
jgi:hypothetical protein